MSKNLTKVLPEIQILTEAEITARLSAARAILEKDDHQKLDLNDENDCLAVGSAIIVWDAAKRFYAAEIESLKQTNVRLYELLNRAFETAIAPLGANERIEPSVEIENLAMEIYHELEKGENNVN